MKKLITTILCCCTFVLYGQTTYPTGTTGCIARWNFTNAGTVTSLPDVSTNGNNGTTYNINSDTSFRRLLNKAMRFNGTSSYATVSHNSMLTPSSMTIISLVKFNGFYSGSCQMSQIISKGYPHFIAGNYGLGVGDNVYDGSCSIFSPSNMQQNNQFANSSPTLSAGNYTQANRWYFMATTYDGNTIKYYQRDMDTAVYYTSTPPIFSQSGLSTAIGTNTQDISIGRHLNPSFPYWVNGSMDELILFNRVLSDSEVHKVYQYLWGGINITTNDTMICGTNTMTVNYTVINPEHFLPGNVFTVQLSNASGSFSSPVNIGSVASVTSGSIVCAIPPATTYGNGYRVRIISSDRQFTSANNGKNIIYGPAVVNVSLGNDTTICTGDSITLTPASTSGASYLWSNSSTGSSLLVKNPGTVWVKATANYCYKYDTVIVTLVPTPVLFIGNDTTICQGSTLNLSNYYHSSGYTYLWSNSSIANNISVTAPGTYIVRAQNLSCYAWDTILVAVNPVPAVSLGNDTSICSGNMLLLYNKATAIPGSTYLWNTSSTTSSISATATGSYWLRVLLNGCQNSDTLNLNIIQTPNVLLGNDTTICQGSTITLHNKGSVGSYTYLWNTGSSAASINTGMPGTYWLKAQLNACADTDTIVIATQSLPLVNLGNDTAVCANVVLSLSNLSSTSPGATILWNTSSNLNIINAALSGQYWLKITDNQCSNTDTINLVHSLLPDVFIGNDTTICDKSSIVLQNSLMQTGYTNLWNTGNTGTSIIANNSGKYYLQVTYNGCINADTVNIAVIQLPEVNLGNDIAVCEGTVVELKNLSATSPAAIFNWSTGASTSSINPITAGTFWLTIIENKCSNSDTVKVFFNPIPIVNIGNDTTICDKDNITLRSNSQPVSSTYLWNDGSKTNSCITAGEGMYILNVTNNGCTASDSMLINTTPSPYIELGNDTSLCQNFSIMLPEVVVKGYNYSFLWTDGSKDSVLTVRKEGRYFVTLSNICGVVSDSINVTFRNCKVWFPSAFSPNGDRLNDIAKLIGDIGNVSEYKLIIYNRWGQNVYTGSDVRQGWDGMFKDKPADVGTYYYIYKVVYRGNEEIVKGDLTLIR